MTKRLVALFLAFCASAALAQTFPVNNINVKGQLQLNGSPGTAGYLLQSNGTAPPTWALPSSQLPYLPVFDVKNGFGWNIPNAVAAANTTGGILYFAANTTFTVGIGENLNANVSVVCGPGAVIETTSATAGIFTQNGDNTINEGCNYASTVPQTAGAFVTLTGYETVLKDFQMTSPFVGITIDGTTQVINHGFINSSVSASMLCSLAGDSHIYGVTSNNGFNVSGYISGTTLTVTTAAPYNSLTTGQYIAASGVAGGTQITALGTGTGGTGTYTVSISQTAGSSGSPLTLNASGTGDGLLLTGNGGGPGCAVTMEGSAMLLGSNSIAAEPPSGGTVFLLAADDYLDNAGNNALVISPASGGSVGYVRVVNSELGVNSVNSPAVAINGVTGAGIGIVDLTGDTIYSYQTNIAAGVLLEGAVTAAGVLITGSDIGLFGYPFASAISTAYSVAASNLVATGNSLKGSPDAFFIQDSSDVSCLIAENRLNGAAHTSTGCNQNNNY